MNISSITKKLINFLSDFDYNHINNFNNEFINKINNIIDNVFINRKYSINKKNILKKSINKNDLPLMYQLFKILLEKKLINNLKINNQLTFKDFINYYNNNNVYDIIYKNKKNIMKNTKENELFNFIFNNKITERNILNNLLYNNNFVSLDIQYYSELNDIFYKNIKYNYNNLELNINLYTIDEIHIPNIQLIINISILMYELSKLYNGKVNKLPILNLFCGLQKKIINNMNNKLFPENVNSGSTLYAEFINIWRFEEIYKVLIHEIIHFYGFDFYIYDSGSNIIEKYVQNKFCVHGDDRTNESYTETLAIIIHSIIISKLTNINLIQIINNEIKFSIFQVNKILLFFNIDNIKLILDQNKCHKNIIQYTSVVSYYFIKLFNLLNIYDFLEFINKYTPFIKKFISQYNKLIDKNINNKSINIINSIKKYINFNINNTYTFSNMRMSLYSLSKL